MKRNYFGKDTTSSSPFRGRTAAAMPLRVGVTRGATKKTIGQSQHLRRNLTEAEKKLWWHLRNGFPNYRFRRQLAVGPYIIDFACLKAKLIVELDGGQHALQKEYDYQRTLYLQQYGFRVVRFWNNDVLQNIDSVVETVFRALDPHPTLPLKGEERKQYSVGGGGAVL